VVLEYPEAFPRKVFTNSEAISCNYLPDPHLLPEKHSRDHLNEAITGRNHRSSAVLKAGWYWLLCTMCINNELGNINSAFDMKFDAGAVVPMPTFCAANMLFEGNKTHE